MFCESEQTTVSPPIEHAGTALTSTVFWHTLSQPLSLVSRLTVKEPGPVGATLTHVFEFLPTITPSPVTSQR